MNPFFFFPLFSKKTKKNCSWEVLVISHNTIQIGSNWYMDTGVRDLEVVFLRLVLPDLMKNVAKIYQIGLYMLC